MQLDLDIYRIVSREEARNTGEKYFFTGKPCKNNHMVLRYTKGGSCSKCTLIANAVKKGKSPESAGLRILRQRIREDAKNKKDITYIPNIPCKNGHLLRWVSTNNCVLCDRETQKNYTRRRKFNRIKKEYGIFEEQYFSLLKSQDGKCKICRIYVEQHFSLHIDHCHKSKKVRGLLCSKCNQAIGLFGENINTMKAAIDYLDAYT